jgi:2-polyprenyl-6-methoxyphenol hydroxylase-like FAD-dependent oxidoreductase
MGGLTLAALLSRRGAHRVTVLERVAHYSKAGYGIGLYPLGGAVFNAIGARDDLLARSQVLSTYRMHGPSGELLQEVDLATLLADFGPMVGISRSDLIDILYARARECVSFGRHVIGAERADRRVRVHTEDGATYEGDVVVVADGMHSRLRTALLGEVAPHDTGFDAWMWWAPADTGPAHVASEYWGPSGFVGLYPMPAGVNVAIAVPSELSPSPDAPADEILNALRSQLAHACPGGAEIPGLWTIADGKPFLWRLQDVRAPDIVALDGRAALLGDAGVGFLPTAGVGASNAIRAAAALAYELSLADAATAPAALERWRTRVHDILIGNQQASRQTAKVMLVRGRSTQAVVRELMKHLPVTLIAHDIVKSMKVPF